jgi:polysaccharide export outer membrane protein
MNTRMRKTILYTLVACVMAVVMGSYAAQAAQDVFSVGTDVELESTDEVKAERAVGEDRYRFTLPELEKVVNPDEYILGPYDQLIINLVGPEPRSFSVLVLPEGDVFLPGVGAIHADGLTLSEFRESLSRTFSRYFKNIELFCYLKTPRRFRVFVTGEVGAPGPVEVSAIERLSDAIQRAGNIKSYGSSRFVMVERGQETLTFDILRFHLEGDFDNNPFLSSGDRIHVPVGQWHAAISGDVRKPGSYEIIPGETIEDLIALAGGFNTVASRDSVLLTRWDGSTGFTTRTVPADEFDTRLTDLDEISVVDRLAGSRRVFVFGAVRRKGRFYLGPGEALLELLIRTGGFEEYAALDSAVVERKDGTRLRVDIRDLLTPGSDVDIPLGDGDILEIPSLYQNVTVGGEVQAPGQFPYRNDWTVAHYVGLAGGPTTEGSIDRAVIVSPDGSSRNVGKDDRPERGDIIIVKRSRYRLLGEFLSGVVRLGTVVVTIIVLAK